MEKHIGDAVALAPGSIPWGIRCERGRRGESRRERKKRGSGQRIRAHILGRTGMEKSRQDPLEGSKITKMVRSLGELGD